MSSKDNRSTTKKVLDDMSHYWEGTEFDPVFYEKMR